MTRLPLAVLGSAFVLGSVAVGGQQTRPAEPQSPDPYRFKSGVELINVAATVYDRNGRFVPDLTRDDFMVYEDEVRREISQFSAERVPVSLGIVLDTSGSMAGEKIAAARGALDRFLYELLDRRDEMFLYRFSDQPRLLQGWTSEPAELSRAMGRIFPEGGTAMYDAVAEAIPLAGRGRNQKKALVVISDGNDTSSHLTIQELRSSIRRSEVLVYAVGIDGDHIDLRRPRTGGIRPPTRRRPPTPFPGVPGRPGGRFPVLPQIGGQGGGWWNQPNDDRVNVVALRDMTDDSGGRTEIVRDPGDLDPATANIADELSKQYFLGYAARGVSDGRWHTIRVEVKNSAYRVRARRGYIAN